MTTFAYPVGMPCVLMPEFPRGCQGCGGACCADDGCKHLTPDGLCKLEVDGGREAKPAACGNAVVGSPDCVAYRVKSGVHE